MPKLWRTNHSRCRERRTPPAGQQQQPCADGSIDPGQSRIRAKRRRQAPVDPVAGGNITGVRSLYRVVHGAFLGLGLGSGPGSDHARGRYRRSRTQRASVENQRILNNELDVLNKLSFVKTVRLGPCKPHVAILAMATWNIISYVRTDKTGRRSGYDESSTC